MIRAIIFDMDGILIEAKDRHYEALNRALKFFGLETSRYEHSSVFDGLPTRDKLEVLNVERGLPRALHHFINEMKQQFITEPMHYTYKPRFCYEFALPKLKNEGYKIAVCSNSIRKSIEVMMQKVALDSYLDFYLSSEDVSKDKLDPQMYNKAIGKFSLNPKECLITENSENGIKAAKTSGANVMMVSGADEVNHDNIKAHVNKFKEAL